ncbi:MAG: hypothetical protein Q7T18_01880 [Sedimentisphaerales bacterium]|nr:hypothetical protein [Sedimentisphaerales bacterium]
MKTMMCVCMVILIAGLGGCKSGCHKTAAVAPVEPMTSDCPRVESNEGMSTQTAVFPGQSANMIRIERVMPAQIRAGQPFDYDLMVTNLTDMSLREVMVMENLGENFQFKSSMPEGKLDGRQLTWMLPELGPKAVQKITVNGMAEKAGKLAQCADVKYKMPACSAVDVVAPQLMLTKTVPSDSLLCDKIPVKYVVTNKGTGVVRNVIITDQLPNGLMTVDGGQLVSLDSCPLGPGQSQEFSVMTRAEKPGEYTSTAMAKADGGLTAESDGVKTMVHEPVLAVTEKGTESGYIGRPIKYEITVTNNGDAPATKAILQKQMPAEAKFISASEGGSFSGGTVTWNLETLAPQASKTVELTYSSDTAGIMKTSTQAFAECATTTASSGQTKIAGIPAILLEMVDISDPILKGENETYVIKVTNQGSAVDTNIRIVATMEDSIQYVSSSGATTGTSEGQKVMFEPLPSLAPKAVATWNVIVKGNKTGDTRFKVDLASDQLGKAPVIKTESTRFYE